VQAVYQEEAMLVAKNFADLITLTRAVIGFCLAWLGISQGAAALPRAVSFLIAAWTSDVADGPVARRSRVQYSSWLGDHDLEVDMAVACWIRQSLVGSRLRDLLDAFLHALGHFAFARDALPGAGLWLVHLGILAGDAGSRSLAAGLDRSCSHPHLAPFSKPGRPGLLIRDAPGLGGPARPTQYILACNG
jgi:hypothetical protein